MTLIKPDKNKPVFKFFPKSYSAIENNQCSICYQDIHEEDFDEEGKKEYSISGMCMECIKKTFNDKVKGGYY